MILLMFFTMAVLEDPIRHLCKVAISAATEARRDASECDSEVRDTAIIAAEAPGLSAPFWPYDGVLGLGGR